MSITQKLAVEAVISEPVSGRCRSLLGGN